MAINKTIPRLISGAQIVSALKALYRKVTTPIEVPDAYSKEDSYSKYEVNDLVVGATTYADEAARKTFDDLWREAFANVGYDWRSEFFNDGFQPITDDGNYNVYGLDTPLTYEEAVGVYDAYVKRTEVYAYGGLEQRAIIPIHEARQTINDICMWAHELETAIIFNSGGTVKNGFMDCAELRKVYISTATATFSNGFNLSSKLEICEIYGLASNLNLSATAVLHAASVRFILNNRKNDGKAYILTLHQTVFDHIVNGDEGWADLLDLAKSKNIQLATP